MKYVNGNLLDTQLGVIAHGCNCSDGFGSGVAGSIAAKWPAVKDAYHAHIEEHGTGPELLGTVQRVPTPTHTVFNCFTQDGYGKDGRVYASLSAIGFALIEVASWCTKNGHTEIAIPQIGCGLGGLKWPEVRALIEELEPVLDVEFTIYWIGNNTRTA